MRLSQRNLVWRGLDVIVAIIFIYAGAVKIMDPIAFGRDLDNYQMLPWAISVRLAFYLPWLEILCGVALVFRYLYRGGLIILTGLVLIFIAATVAAKGRGLDITCGCFGHISQHWSFAQHLSIDMGIAVALVGLCFRQLADAPK